MRNVAEFGSFEQAFKKLMDVPFSVAASAESFGCHVQTAIKHTHFELERVHHGKQDRVKH